MALTPSTMLPLGSALPDFALPDGLGRVFSRDALLRGRGLLVAFICNHCPYVVHINPALAPFGDELATLDIGMAAISSNDIEAYPSDAPDLMVEVAARSAYSFPYLYDEDQSVARAFDAACTPDFFLFDGAGRLVYRGQFDDTRPGGAPAHGSALREAAHALAAGSAPLAVQRPSVGCNIKWKHEG
ncbi:thioredoxin family protein [Chitinibacteraceae bacterium HSL-7]